MPLSEIMTSLRTVRPTGTEAVRLPLRLALRMAPLALVGCSLGATVDDVAPAMVLDAVAPESPLPDGGNSLRGESPPAPAALVAACTELYRAYRDWDLRCTGADLARDALDGWAHWCAFRAELPGLNATPEAILGCRDKLAVSACSRIPYDCEFELPLGTSADAWSWFASTGYRVVFPRTRGTLGVGELYTDCRQCPNQSCYARGDGCGVCIDHVPVGAACSLEHQCESFNVCKSGVCVPTGPAVGDPCVEQFKGGGSNCRPEMYCHPVTLGGGAGQWSGTCQLRAAAGQPCEELQLDESCVTGARCRAGVCKATSVAPVGAPCDNDLVRCTDGNYCESGTCAPAPPPQPSSFCFRRTECPLGQACVNGSCITALREGTTCQSQFATACAANLVCLDGVCRRRAAEGQPCKLYGCADGLVCNKVCQRAIAEGGRCGADLLCAFPLECTSGLCRRPSQCNR